MGLFLMGCSDKEDAIIDNDQAPSSESVARSYLTVRMVAASQTGTRAEGDETKAPWEYEDGTALENAVSRVRFYFFDDNGDAAAVRKLSGSEGNNYQSYIDWYPSDADAGPSIPGETVEKTLNATLGLNLREDIYPTQVLAVLNPSTSVLGLSYIGYGPSLADLRDVVEDFKTGLNGTAADPENGKFVMSNSVYVENGNTVYAKALDKDNDFGTTVEEAEKNKVTIYVERVLARIDLRIDMDSKIIGEGDDAFYIYNANKNKTETSTNGNQYDIDGVAQDVYVKFLGWNITGTTETSRLIKEFPVSWNAGEFAAGDPWNTADYHRSFWALNPEKPSYQYGNFGEATTNGKVGNYANALPIPIPASDSKTTYLQENAADYEKTEPESGTSPAIPSAENAVCSTPTKVIIAAQLVDGEGKVLELAEWANKKYTLASVKTALANALDLYYTRETMGETKFTKISPDDLDFITENDEDFLGNAEEEPDYYVYAVLTEDAAKKTWYNGNTQTSTPYPDTKAVNTYIRNAVNHVMVWKKGYTYYYFDIRHLGQTEDGAGYYGIVRNHLYKASVTKVEGLGTPVYDPDEVIYPEMPENDDAMLSVDIKILQWRIVENDYELVW